MNRYFCRVCDSSNGWTSPSGFASETGASHFGSFGFAYEEWNFSPSMQLDGWQYGWIEGFQSGIGRRNVPPGPHQVATYFRRSGKNYWAGTFALIEKLPESPQCPFYTPALVQSARSAGANIRIDENGINVEPIASGARMKAYTRQYLVPNVRFRVGAFRPAAGLIDTGIAYSRYGPLLVSEDKELAGLWRRLNP